MDLAKIDKLLNYRASLKTEIFRDVLYLLELNEFHENNKTIIFWKVLIYQIRADA
jgi:hypothetical protein